MGDEEHSTYCSLCPQSRVCCMTALEVHSCIQDPKYKLGYVRILRCCCSLFCRWAPVFSSLPTIYYLNSGAELRKGRQMWVLEFETVLQMDRLLPTVPWLDDKVAIYKAAERSILLGRIGWDKHIFAGFVELSTCCNILPFCLTLAVFNM